MAQGGVYLLIGPDRARQRERVDALAHALGVDWLDRHHLDAATASPRELAMLLREFPAASPLRLIVLEDAARLPAPCARVLHELHPRLTDTACLVLLVEDELPASHPLASILSTATTERVPGGALVGEAAGRPSGGRGGFALIEAVIRRDAGGALSIVHEQLAEGKEPLELLGLLMWQLQRWLVVGEGLQARLPREQLLALGGLQAWQLDRLSAEVSSRPPAWVRDLLWRCWEMDLAAKTGRLPTAPAGQAGLPMMLAAVEQVVVELCQPAVTRRTGTPTAA